MRWVLFNIVNQNPRTFKLCIKISLRLRKSDFILESKMAKLNQNKNSK